MKKRILSMLLVIVMVLSMVPVSALADGIKITGKNYMEVGQSVKLSLTGITAENGSVVSGDISVATVTWDSAKPGECTVSGVSAGKTVITAQEGETKQTFAVAVYEKANTAPTITTTKTNVALNGGDVNLEFSGGSGDATKDVVRWSSSNTSVATITYKGVLTPKAEGTTDITVFCNGQTSAPVKFTVDSRTLNVTGSADSMYVGEKLTLNTKIGETAADASFSVTGGEEIVKVNKTATGTFEVVGEAAGTVQITFTTTDENGITYTSAPYTITVNALKTMSIQREGNTDPQAGKTISLGAFEGSTKLTGVAWSSNNPNVAEIDSSGKMTCKAAGTVTITAKLKNYKDDTRTFDVGANALQILYKANQTTNSPLSWINEGAELQLVVEDAAGNELAVKEWGSSNEAAATVDKSGKLKAISRSAGATVEITAKVDGFAEPAKQTVNINCLTIAADNVELYVGDSLTLAPKINGAAANDVTVAVDTRAANTGSVTFDATNNYKFTGTTAGTVVLKLTKDGYSGTCTVTVKRKPLTIKADNNATKFYVGKTYQLKAYDNEDNVVAVNWKSGDSKAVEIASNGKMTVLVAGVGKTITVTATPKPTDANTYAEATLDVKVLANSLEITAANGEPLNKLYVDEFVDLVAKDGNGEVVSDVIWSVTPSGVAEFVSGSRLRGIRPDKVTITASKEGYTDGTADIDVALKPIEIKKGEQVAEEKYKLNVNDTLQLKAFDEKGNPVVVDWASTDSEAVSVSSSGLVTAVKSTRRETVKITASLHGYETKTVAVTVVPASVIATVKLEGEDRPTELNVGETRKLVALDPDGFEIADVTWKRGNTNAVMVEDGLHGEKAGQVSVTARSATHGEKSVLIDVKFVDVTGFELGELPAADEDGYILMEIDDKLPLNITNVQPGNASDPTAIDWTSTDATVAKVEDGKIVALEQGYATLKAYPAAQTDAQQRAVREPLCVLKIHVLGEERIVLDEAMPGEILAGKALDLKAAVVYANGDPVPKTSVKWTLLSEEEGVSLSLTNDKLETRSDMEYRHNIRLLAEAVGSDAEPIEVMVTVIPVTTSITLMVGEKKVNNQVYVVDLSDETLVENGIVVTASILPRSATQMVRWEITDPGNVSIEEQWDTDIALIPVPSLKSGIVTVTAYAGDGTGEKATAKIQFSRLGAGKLKDDVPQHLRGGASLDLSSYLVRDENADDKTVTWSIENNVVNGRKIASISKSGKLTTKPVTAAKTITVTVKGASNVDGAEDRVYITLHPATKSITISGAPKTVEFGKRDTNGELKEYPLSVKVNPEIPVDENGRPVWDLVWSSTNKNVAEVNEDNVLIIKGPGKVRIDCTTTDGSKVKGSVYLEVISTVNTVTVSPDGRSLKYGDSLDMKAVIKTPTNRNAADQRVTWSIADEYGNDTDAAIITATGRVTAKDVGQNTKVVVTATSVANPEISGVATVTIKPNTNKTLHAFIDDKMVSGTISMNLNDACVLDPMWQKTGSGDLKDAEDCQFFSSNTGVATVDDGLLTAVGYGTSKITLRCVDPQTGNTYTSTFTVKVMKLVSTVTINAPTVKDLRSGKSVSLSATAWTDYSNNVKADNQGFTWEVYDVEDDVVKLDRASKAASIGSNGVLYGSTVSSKKVVEVWAVSKENGIAAKVRFNIFPADSVSLAFKLGDEECATTLPIDIDDYSGDNSNVLPLKVWVHEAIADAKGNIAEQTKPDVDVNWSSDNKNVVEVTNSGLLVKAIGRAKLTAKYYRAADRRTYQASITVVVNQTMGGIDIQQSTILVSGKYTYMRAIPDNENATNKNVLWSVVEGEDYVTINAYTGKLSAKPRLTEQVTVTVHAEPVDGTIGDDAEVIVYPLTTKVEIFGEDPECINNKTVEVARSDGMVSFDAQATPDDAYQATFKWTSSNKSVAEVDEEGNVTLKKTGIVTIKATALDGSGKYAKFKLRITNN